ncbi:MAG: hypothetical protein H3C43_12815 [Leptonema sp. (in: Bacteria)]|nr:hypothetical protein [Leptonema sp. (in: bacteria)]
MSFILLALAFIPILFPIVIGFSALLSVTMILLLWQAQKKGEFTKTNSDPTGPVSRIESRILRRSILAAAISVFLYCIFWIWTQFFYILPLKKSQEPFRQDSQTINDK